MSAHGEVAGSVQTDKLTTWERLSPGCQHVLKEMCERVGIGDPTTIDYKADRWYMAHDWTEEDELRFVNWLATELMGHAWLRQDLMEHPRREKRHCRATAEEFLFNYGWRRSEPPEGQPSWAPQYMRKEAMHG